MKPKVSIIVPVYNVEKYLEQCLDSLINQTLEEIEIICVNDGSTDKSLSILNQYAKDDPRIIIINQKNKGLSAARNAGMKLAKGEYIGFVDSDDWVDTNMFKEMYQSAASNKTDITMCALARFDQRSKKINFDDPYYCLSAFNKYFDGKVFSVKQAQDILFVISVTAVNKIYSKEFIKEIGALFPVGVVFEDNPFFYETFLSAKRVTITREPYYFYRVNRADAITSLYHKKHFEVIKIQDYIDEIFRKSGYWPKFKHKLFEIRLYVFRDIYKKMEPALKLQFLINVKGNLINIISRFPYLKTSTRIPGDLIAFCNAIVGAKYSSTAEFDEAVSEQSMVIKRKNNSNSARILNKLRAIRSRVIVVFRKIRILPFSGVDGAKDIIKYFFRTINRSKSKAKIFLGNHLSESSRRTIKRIAAFEFLKIKVRDDNELWSGPLVTVITTFYNQKTTILETVGSVLGQRFTNFEYLIVNDGSKKNERKILDEIRDERVRIIDTPHIGHGSPAPARNLGIKQAKGKYIMCLDGDDMIKPTYLEKLVSVLESNHNYDIAATNMVMFGARNCDCIFGKYKPQRLIRQNLIAAPSLFRASLAKKVGGYREDIGYEDWEFWIRLVEHGAHAININEKLIKYRVAPSSRYTEDLKRHNDTYKKIVSYHRFYRLKVAFFRTIRFFIDKRPSHKTAYINLGPKSYQKPLNKGVMIAIPWMTFGGVETLVQNVTKNLKDELDFTFVTGLYSDHGQEESYEQITDRIYHLPYLFLDKEDYIDFLNNLIKVNGIKVLHIFHSEFLFAILERIKTKNPELKVIVSLFNDQVSFLEKALKLKGVIDVYSSDNNYIGNNMAQVVGRKAVKILPNGLDNKLRFNPEKYNRNKIRKQLSIPRGQKVVTFIGRLSAEGEKNPEFILKLAEISLKDTTVSYLIVGTGPAESKLHRMAENLGNIRFLGYRSDVPEILAASDFYILPSKVEGSPQGLVEAMAMGKIVLAAAVGGIPDIIDNRNGFLIDVSSPKSVYEIIKGTEPSSKAGKLAMKTIADRYTIEKMVSKYRDLYES